MTKIRDPQEEVVKFGGRNMLVSASAGTGKTTTMIARIAKLILDGADVSQLVVVTFTKLAAAEMKNRLAAKLAEFRNNARIVEQIEKLDSASICTIDAFCAEILRNFFYVADIDPSFAIVDSVTSETLRANAMDEVFQEYFKSKDELFKKVYKILATGRKEDNFKEALFKLYNFSRTFGDFNGWYNSRRQNFVNYSEANPLVVTLLEDITQEMARLQEEMSALAAEAEALGSEFYAAKCRENEAAAKKVDCSSLAMALDGLYKLSDSLTVLQSDRKISSGDASELRKKFNESRKRTTEFAKIYSGIGLGRPFEQVWDDTAKAVELTDKLVEILNRFDEKFFAVKKQRGVLDFADLEHLALKVLCDDEAIKAISERYTMVFVDEYQDTNSLQESIISRLAETAKLFMVGDVKQSIYGFRGCDPTIFLSKYHNFKQTGGQNCASIAEAEQNKLVELNKNFRSNCEILNFVNDVFDVVMTENFGQVDYVGTSRLEGVLPPVLDTPSVQLDFVSKQVSEKKEAEDFYDITFPSKEADAVAQGDVIAQKITEFIGLTYTDKRGNFRRVGYGDIVILVRGLEGKATDIYNALVEHNIPVAANFRTETFSGKEIKDIINLLRTIDNPYNDIYAVGASLSPLGGFSQNDLAQIKIATSAERIPFCVRMKTYLGISPDDAISAKISKFFKLLDSLRLYSHGATVDEVVLRILKQTGYHLYVQGFPNGTLRLRKLYAFVDGLKGASYAQSVSKFLYFIDRSELEAQEPISSVNAVRLMTMHSSKGLEFPIVILADVDHNFYFEPQTIQRNLGLGLAMKHYDFEQMRVFDTLGTRACGMFNRKSQQEEEMRLLYVAMTRAEYVLDIVATVPDVLPNKAPQAATSHLDWILTALHAKYGDLNAVLQSQIAEAEAERDVAAGVALTQASENNDGQSASANAAQESQTDLRSSFARRKITEKITFYTHKPQVVVAKEQLLCPQETDEEAVLKKISYVYPFADQTGMPNKIVSSALDREFIDTDSERADDVLYDNADRNALGTAYHKVFQYVSPDAGAEEVAETVNGLVNEGKISADVAQKIDFRIVLDVFANPEFRRILSSGKVYREMPFMLVAPYNQIAKDKHFSDEVMLQGVIDLLVLRGDKAIVVDYKFSVHESERLRSDYRYQLNSYRLAVQKICGVTDVECYILSIGENKLIPMGELS